MHYEVFYICEVNRDKVHICEGALKPWRVWRLETVVEMHVLSNKIQNITMFMMKLLFTIVIFSPDSSLVVFASIAVFNHLNS